MLPRNAPRQTWFLFRMGGVSLQAGKQADTHLNQTKGKQMVTYPCPASRWTGDRPSESSTDRRLRSDGDRDSRAHCIKSADYGGGGGIIYWACHWFSNGFSRGHCSVASPNSLLIHLFATSELAQHGPQQIIVGELKLGIKAGQCHR